MKKKATILTEQQAFVLLQIAVRHYCRLNEALSPGSSSETALREAIDRIHVSRTWPDMPYPAAAIPMLQDCLRHCRKARRKVVRQRITEAPDLSEVEAAWRRAIRNAKALEQPRW